MLKIKYKDDGALLRIGSRKNFRISSRKLETMRERRRFDLVPGVAVGEIVVPTGPPPSGSPPNPNVSPPLLSRTAINNEQ